MSKDNRSRCFFLTINESAECYGNIEECLKETNFTLYALIKHDKDQEEDGTLKKTHYHAMLEVVNPVTFLSMQKKFKGAHIEIPNYKKSAYQYLLHNSPNSKSKYQYDFNEIISNSPDSVKSIIESETKEPFIENMFMRYIAMGIRTPYQFANIFGFDAFNRYWKTYAFMLNELSHDEDMLNDLKKVSKEMEDELPF